MKCMRAQGPATYHDASVNHEKSTLKDVGPDGLRSGIFEVIILHHGDPLRRCKSNDRREGTRGTGLTTVRGSKISSHGRECRRTRDLLVRLFTQIEGERRSFVRGTELDRRVIDTLRSSVLTFQQNIFHWQDSRGDYCGLGSSLVGSGICSGN